MGEKEEVRNGGERLQHVEWSQLPLAPPVGWCRAPGDLGCGRPYPLEGLFLCSL